MQHTKSLKKDIVLKGNLFSKNIYLNCLYLFSFDKILVMGHFDDLFRNSGLDDEIKEGRDYYLENGYRVMTETYLKNRGYCCANGCRHCPYWPKAQKGNRVLKEK